MPKSEARQNAAGEKQVMASGSAGGHDIDGDEIIHLKTQNGGPGRDKKVFVSVFTNKPRCDNWSDPEQLDQYIQDLTGWIYFMTLSCIILYLEVVTVLATPRTEELSGTFIVRKEYTIE